VLKQIAGQHHAKRISRTFVLIEPAQPNRILAYYALNIRGLITSGTLPLSLASRLPGTVPALTIGRLAVDATVQSEGHGAAMLAHAMRRAKAASDLVGGTFLLVDATDGNAANFYAKFRFHPLAHSPLTLAIPIEAIP
jgi:GNAT superfamily N-acetyltransferase